MRFLLNSLIDSNSFKSQEHFESEFKGWLLEKECNIHQNYTVRLPDDISTQVHTGSGVAVFHNEYIPHQSDHLTNRRYFLSRCWDRTLPAMTLFGMSPSAASSSSNDPTVEFMIKVAKYNGFGSLYVINTSTYIKSRDSRKRDFVVDEQSWEYIQHAVKNANLVVLAWGEKGQKFGIPKISSHYPLRRLLEEHSEKLRIFEWGGLNTKQKFPKHPLQRKPFGEDHRLLTLTSDDFNAIIP